MPNALVTSASETFNGDSVNCSIVGILPVIWALRFRRGPRSMWICTILEMIAMLRASGHRCYLASNQEPYRARYMSETLLYKAAFDGEFYSCTVGHAKPAPSYFRAILDALALRAEDTLFIDELSTNVEAARGVGLRASVFAPAPDQRWHDHLRRVLANHGLRLEPHDS